MDELDQYGEPVHRAEIWGATHYPSQVRKVWVRCNCGYLGGPFHNVNQAENDRDEHVLAMTHT